MSLLVLIVILLASPLPERPAQLQCTTSCVDMGQYQRCFYDLRSKCRRRESVCVESDTVECAPLVVNLGPWNPIPSMYMPEYDGNFKELTTSVPESYQMKAP